MSAEQRDAMVETQLVARGMHEPAVLSAMRAVPREQLDQEDGGQGCFVPDGQTVGYESVS